MKIQAFKSLIGNIYEKELDCIKEDYWTEIRGIIQSDRNMGATATTTDFSKFVAQHADQFVNVINKYKNKIRGFNNRKQNIDTISV
jgi:hypothetical protein